MATWPTTLPSLPLQDNFSEQSADGVLRSKEGEPTVERRRYSAVPTAVTHSLRLSRAQKTTLDTLYYDTLAGGAIPFDYTDPLTGATLSVRFLEPPDPQLLDFEVLASLSLEVLP